MTSHPAVYTLSFNSCVDHTFYLNSIRFDDINRIEKSRVDAGGKGLNVARMLHILGYQCEALTFLGGPNGTILKKLLEDERIPFRYVPIKGNTRSIFNFIAGKKVLRINEKGPLISRKEKDAFLNLVYSLNFSKGDILSISGSVPPGIEKSICRDIIKKLRTKGGIVTLDTDGETLKEGIKGIPHIIKPNLWELTRITGRRIRSFHSLKDTLNSLIDSGISTVLLTNGENGAILFSRKHFLYGRPPAVKVLSTIGCGDAFLAGFLYGYCKNKPPEECLRLAVAAGTAKVLKEGTSMPGRSDVMKILKKVKIVNASETTTLSFF
ncbi:MAG TPA: 1-phosphofructokinase family hexose kinase [bacterium]|nr:1-phosphofructokinase family hexose kinase [bacterium]HPP29876.1 1-phosphofructokinase family hexose kinase [bacterium]